MRFDRAAISFAPRTTLNCLDLAFLFVHRFFPTLAALGACVAVPVCALTYVFVERFDGDLFGAFALFLLTTPVLSVLLISGVAPGCFGEPLTVRAAFGRLGFGGAGLALQAVLWRVVSLAGAMVFLFPGWYAAVRTGFFIEKKVLSKLDGHLHDRRTSELLKGEIVDLMFRALVLSLLGLLLWTTLLVTIDFAATYLLGVPILWGRLNADTTYLPSDWDLDPFMEFLWRDPIVVTAAVAAAFLAYVPLRLAWFFCYVDVRVRRDCWDMELEILREAARLEAVSR